MFLNRGESDLDLRLDYEAGECSNSASPPHGASVRIVPDGLLNEALIMIAAHFTELRERSDMAREPLTTVRLPLKRIRSMDPGELGRVQKGKRLPVEAYPPDEIFFIDREDVGDLDVGINLRAVVHRDRYRPRRKRRVSLHTHVKWRSQTRLESVGFFCVGAQVSAVLTRHPA